MPTFATSCVILVSNVIIITIVVIFIIITYVCNCLNLSSVSLWFIVGTVVCCLFKCKEKTNYAYPLIFLASFLQTFATKGISFIPFITFVVIVFSKIFWKDKCKVFNLAMLLCYCGFCRVFYSVCLLSLSSFAINVTSVVIIISKTHSLIISL